MCGDDRYAMQTPNDEDESWKDIMAWGYDEQLQKTADATEPGAVAADEVAQAATATAAAP